MNELTEVAQQNGLADAFGCITIYTGPTLIADVNWDGVTDQSDWGQKRGRELF